ncbi:hypothetical protein GOBAR_AA40323 [Gossypium barbadense]|uniref:Uncharacterized protein n=1 Tax=Gossypium barbadense TaxID=3634 RepID=A0A2P5VNG4_GOSBA|nr:hypothetical protein GOBAR_AA40323 [Gossypium barbadense]
MDDVLLSFDIAGVDATAGVGAQGLDLSDTVRRMEEYIPQVIVEAATSFVIFLAKRDGIDKLVKTFQYVSKLVNWQVETTHPDLANRFKQWEVSSGLSRKAFRTGRFLTGFNGLRRNPGATPTFKFLAVLANAGEMVYFFFDHFLWLSRIGTLDAKLAKRMSFISAFAAEIEPNPFCNHPLSLGISGLVSAWAGWYRNWPS